MMMHKTVLQVCKFVGIIVCVLWCVGWAQDSREDDSLALVSLSELNGSLGWNMDTPIDTWSGVTAGTGATDRVTSLYIGNKNVGTLPAEIGNLTKLESLVANNNLISEIPTEIGNCTELIELVFESNQLYSIPVEVGSLTKLLNLTLSTNYIASLPAEIGNLSSLIILYLEENDLSSIPPELKNLSALTTLSLNGNHLHFDDIELMKGVETFYYSPQKIIGVAKKDTLTPGLKIGVSVRGSKNHYAWTKDSVAFGGDSDSISVTEAGVYACTITSDSITDLTLTHQPITVVDQVPITVDKKSSPLFSDFTIVSNLCNDITTIRYRLSGDNLVDLSIYTLTGQKITTLISERQSSGHYDYEWNTADMAHGTYFCRFTTNNDCITKKMMLLK